LKGSPFFISKLLAFFAKESKISEFNAASRERNYRQQVVLSGIFKILLIVLNLSLVPLLISFLGQERYGIWITLISIGSWISFMDIGIGNGMRNKLAEALASGQNVLARKYVSTAYISLGSIVFILLLFLWVGFSITDIPFQLFFNTKIATDSELINGFLIVMSTILINFVFLLINQILNALQENSLTAINVIVTNVILVFGLLIGPNYIKENLIFYVATLYSIALLIGSVSISIYTFYKNKHLIPKIKCFDPSLIRNIVSLGGQFFLIQISVVIIFSTDNMIITQIIGPEAVTPYNVAQKIFTSIFGVVSLIMAPLWSAYTEAYSKKDFKWIKNKLLFLLKLFIPYNILIAGVALFFDFIKNLWVGEKVIIENSLVWLMALFAVILFWNSIFANFVNGLGKVKLQLWVSIFGALINIPLSIFFLKETNLGVSGVILATSFSLILGGIVVSLQTYLIVNKSAKGIWIK
jgi:O-antigen/teichoic acid export membrane protein